MMSDHGHFFSYEGHKERRTGKIRGAFSRMHRALNGWMLARAPASETWTCATWTFAQTFLRKIWLEFSQPRKF